MMQNESNDLSNVDKDSSTWRTFLKLSPYIIEHKFLLFLSIIL